MLKQFRKDYGLTQKDCERLSGIPRQSIAYFEEKEDRKNYFVTKQMSRYIDWVRQYKASHMSIRETAECLAEQVEKENQQKNKKTIWQKLKSLFGIK